MPSLSYPMLAIQFLESEWMKIISPAICATLNAAGIVKNLVRAVLYGPEQYQGLEVKNQYFLQEIIHTMAFLSKCVCNSFIGQLLQANAEAFSVEIGIPFSLTATIYNEKSYAYYMPLGWYKSLWKFTSNALYHLDLLEDYIIYRYFERRYLSNASFCGQRSQECRPQMSQFCL